MLFGIPKLPLANWVRLQAKGHFKGASDKPLNPEQMELVRLRAGSAPLRMERYILGKAKRTSRGYPFHT